MHSSYRLGAFVAALLLVPGVPAEAHRVWPMVGASPGDLTVTTLCKPGDHIQGFRGRIGLWIDQIQPICQTQRKAEYVAGDALGGTGGGPFELRCKRAWHLSAIKIDLTSDTKRVKNVVFYCSDLENASGAQDRFAIDDLTEDSKSRDACLRTQTPCEMLDQERFMAQQECPGESFVGMTVRFGKDINSIGFICDPVPVTEPPA